MHAYLGSFGAHDSLLLQIRLVSNKKLVHTFVGVAVNLLKPLLDIVECF